MVDLYTLYFDGSCGPKNPGGTAAYGYSLSKCADLLEEKSAVLGSGAQMTNNVAEYAGLYEGLAAFSELVKDPHPYLIVRGDSKLVINQMSGKWRARSGLYMFWYQMTERLVSNLRHRGAKITFEWIPREYNTRCDELSKEHQRD